MLGINLTLSVPSEPPPVRKMHAIHQEKNMYYIISYTQLICTPPTCQARVASVRTVFAQSDTVATINFITQFCVAFIQEQLLFENSVY